MELLINKLKLKLLLEKRRQQIGHRTEGYDVLLTGVLFIASLFCSDFRDLFGVNHLVYQTVAWVLGLAITGYGIIKIIISRKHSYSHDVLYNEIENLDEILHRFSLVAIKDTFNEFPNRFLVYYEESWRCWFFFSFPTVKLYNEESVTQRLSNKLKIGTDSISLTRICGRIQPKHSRKDDVNKVYQHTLYYAEISNFPSNLREDEFTIDGIDYKWMTLEEMENDPVIREINGDVVTFVKEVIG